MSIVFERGGILSVNIGSSIAFGKDPIIIK